MTPRSEWRLLLARALAQQYATNGNVRAVFVGGSVARGQVDRYSDVELCVVWNRAPTEEERAAVVAAVGGDLHRLYPVDAQLLAWEDLYFVGRDANNTPKSGCHVEVTHILDSALAAHVDRVLDDHDPDLALQNLMAGIVYGIPVHGELEVNRHKARLREYPQALQIAVIQRYGTIDHFWRNEMFVARGDNRMELAALLTDTLRAILVVLCGINRVYCGGFKWLDALLARLPLAPPDLGARIRRVYALPPSEAAHVVASIAEQTFDLADSHVPDVDVARLRQIFTYRRPQWEEPPAHLPL